MRKFSSPRLLLPVVIAALVVVLTFALAGAAAPGPSAQANASGVVPNSPTGVLYSQTDNASGDGAPAQDFEAQYNIYDSEGADDFVVPANTQWTVDGVVIVGTSGGTTPSVDVAIYPDSATYPGATAVCSYLDVTTLTGSGTLNITLPTPCVLGPGTYWLAFMSNQTFAGSGQYFWSNRSTTSNSGSVWRNPGGGFGTGCAAWTRQTTCGVGGGVSPDFLFQISGTAGPVAAPSINVAKTVSDDGSCGVSNTISVPYGSVVTYCYQVENTGDITLTQHTVVDDMLGTLLSAAPYDLAPGGTFSFTTDYTLTVESVTNVMTWTAFITGTQVSASGSASATVTGQPTDVSLTAFSGQNAASGLLILLVAGSLLLMGIALRVRRQS